ncbi:DNA cytosine methyltransferase [Pseudomonas tolaasii]|uniref:DNA cytosine methyltransferase n=1 Tax=Pseudomonas tolaasii TaxID=29442 RepID=UPI001C5EE2C3|nr:DNA cytosine methyltransferase [Pseudomonas tolaasii]MBW4795531.1 DNA cytosine methyltransferase [Pseudomonas tolaasii]
MYKKESPVNKESSAGADNECFVLSEKSIQSRVLTGVDLFAGAGGFSLAAKNVGVNVVAAVELNAKACESYRHNIVKESGPKLYEENLLTLHPGILKENHFSHGEECDILLGGPPCQGFSVHRIKDAGVDDPRNKLLFRYFEYVQHLRAKIFLMENVPGLLWPRHKPFLDALYIQGASAGYTLLPPVVIDARDYGVPQRRKRVFVLGVRNDIELDIEWPPKRTHSDPSSKLHNPDLLSWLPASDVFSRPPPLMDENNRHMNHSQELISVFKQTPINGGSRKDSGRVLPCHGKHDGHTDVYGRIDPSVPGPTMTTACINPSKGRFVHPIENHGITLRQAARFQTFPDDYVFKGGLIAAGVQIGNAVPVLLGEVLLKAISESLVRFEGI